MGTGTSRDADALHLREVPRMLADNVLIRPREKTHVGMIAIPETAQKKATVAVVVAAGPGRRSDYCDAFHETPVRTGEVVIYNRHARTQNVYIDDVLHYQIKAGELLAVVDGEHDVKVGATDA